MMGMAEGVLRLPALEELRKRLSERMESIRARVPILSAEQRSGLLRGEGLKPQVIGQGKIIEAVSQTVDKLVQTIKEKRPNIIPTVLERIKTFEPGKRIKELLPPIGEGVAGPTPPPTPPPGLVTTAGAKSKLLRE